MKFKYYFSKDFSTCDDHELETLRTHYYRCKKDDAIEAVRVLVSDEKAKLKSVDTERGEVIFDSVDYNATATITALSYTEIAIDFTVFTYNILPTALGKKVIEKFYKILDKKLDFKGIGLYKNR